MNELLTYGIYIRINNTMLPYITEIRNMNLVRGGTSIVIMIPVSLPNI